MSGLVDYAVFPKGKYRSFSRLLSSLALDACHVSRAGNESGQVWLGCQPSIGGRPYRYHVAQVVALGLSHGRATYDSGAISYTSLRTRFGCSMCALQPDICICMCRIGQMVVRFGGGKTLRPPKDIGMEVWGGATNCCVDMAIKCYCQHAALSPSHTSVQPVTVKCSWRRFSFCLRRFSELYFNLKEEIL